MTGVLRLVLFPLLMAIAFPVAAQKYTPAQEMAKPGESSEPPPPHAAPAGAVESMPLPHGGGILVFGGTHGTGLEVVKDLVAMKQQVTVVSHSGGDNAVLKHLGVAVVAGNALDADSLKPVFQATPYRIVISTLGGKRGEPSPDFDGNKNVIEAAKKLGIPRFILVTSIGAGNSEDATPWMGLARFFFGKSLTEKTLAEEYLKASGLDYTIIRPGGLLDKPASGQAKLVEDPKTFSFIARADLGKLVASCISNDKTDKKVFSAIDPTRTSFLSRFRD